MRMTRQRSAISELLEETNEFLPAQRIHELLVERGERVGLATVYRNLQAMADQGAVDVLRQENSDVQLFRYCKHDGHHHRQRQCRSFANTAQRRCNHGGAGFCNSQPYCRQCSENESGGCYWKDRGINRGAGSLL